jgi:hypothetical protein
VRGRLPAADIRVSRNIPAILPMNRRDDELDIAANYSLIPETRDLLVSDMLAASYH